MDDYKKYSLEQLDNWIHDAISCSEATPQEIYDTIHKAVQEEYYAYKHRTSQAYKLLALLNGNGKGHITAVDPKGNEVPVDTLLCCDKDDPSPECTNAWNKFWQNDSVEYDLREAEYYNKNDKVKKWSLPVEVDELSGECYVNLPDDLLEAAGMKEGDQITWIDNGDGSFSFKKFKTHDEMIADSWTMTADGFWIKEN